MEGLVSLLPLVAIALLFWLMIIRPASRRQKDQIRMQSSLTLGDQVVLTSGIFGTITELTDERLMVEVAPGVAVRVARGAIGSVVPTEEPEPEAESEVEATEGDESSENN